MNCEGLLNLQHSLELHRGSGLLPLDTVSTANFACIALLRVFIQRSEDIPDHLTKEINRCIIEFNHQFNQLLTQDCSYFEVHNPVIYQSDLSLLADYLLALSEACTNGGDALYHFCRVPSDLLCIPASTHLLIMLFWAKSFCGRTEVSWQEFEAAFSTLYGDQPAAAMSCFQRSIRSLVSDHHSSTVDIFVLNELVGPSRTLFAAFDALCASQTRVVVSGFLLEGEITYPTPTVLRSLMGLSIVNISCGDQHACVVTDAGQLYSWGKGSFGRLGHGDETNRSSPTLVPYSKLVPMKLVSCGFAFTGSVSQTGRLYMWGAGMNGRLGHNNELNHSAPMRVTSLDERTIASVHTGSVHSCAVTNEGMVLSFGKGDYCGHGSDADVWIPKLLPQFVADPARIASIASGGFHTLVLTQSGRVYSWGHNRVGQLGQPTDGMQHTHDGGYYQPTPRLVTSGVPEDVTTIATGWGHSCLLTGSGELYACGRNVEGQLGIPESVLLPVNERGHRYQPSFVRIVHPSTHLRRLRAVCCGGEHTLLLSGLYDVLGVGLSSRGQLLQSMSEPAHMQWQARLLPFLQDEKREVLAMSAGFSCSMFVLGGRQPNSLRQLCSQAIRSNAGLAALVEGVNRGEGEVEEFLEQVRASME